MNRLLIAIANIILHYIHWYHYWLIIIINSWIDITLNRHWDDSWHYTLLTHTATHWHSHIHIDYIFINTFQLEYTHLWYTFIDRHLTLRHMIFHCFDILYLSLKVDIDTLSLHYLRHYLIRYCFHITLHYLRIFSISRSLGHILSHLACILNSHYIITLYITHYFHYWWMHWHFHYIH